MSKKSKAVRFAIIGASGRMGCEILEVISEDQKTWKPQLAISSSKKVSAFKKTSSKVQDLSSKDVDLVIDFSSPDAFRATVKALSKDPIPFVSGTTGLEADDMKSLKALAKKTAVFWAPNTSLGVATLKHALQSLRAVADYDFQVEEIHHKFKKDAPSGTAKFLKAEVDALSRRKSPEALAIRGGGVPGLHRVWAIGPEEWLCFEHMAFQRKVFARGAVAVAAWLVQQKPGLYTMDDFLTGRTA